MCPKMNYFNFTIGGKQGLPLLTVDPELKLLLEDDEDEELEWLEPPVKSKPVGCWPSKEPITEATGAIPSSETCEVPPSLSY